MAPEPSATVRNTADGEEAHQGHGGGRLRCIPHCRASPGPIPHWRRRHHANAVCQRRPDGQNANRPLQDHGSDPAHSDLNQHRGDYSTVAPVPNRSIRAYIGAKSPLTDTTASANSPAVSSPEAFRTPALAARRTVSDGQASENP